MSTVAYTIDEEGYIIAEVPIGTPNSYTASSDHLMTTLLMPKWGGEDFIEGLSTASFIRQERHFGSKQLLTILAAQSLKSLSFDTDMRLTTTPTQEIGDTFTSWLCTPVYTSTGGGAVDIFDLQFTGINYIVDGTLVFVDNNNAPGNDYFEVEVVDIDDIFGFGPLTILRTLVHPHPVVPGRIRTYAGWGVEPVPPGVYFRFKYTSHASSGPQKFWYELNRRTP